jgi:hypothetical protein
MDNTIAGSMNDNINMDSTIAGPVNDNINPIKKRGENLINQFNLTTLVCLSQARTWNSIVIEVFFMFNDLMLEAIVCFGILQQNCCLLLQT